MLCFEAKNLRTQRIVHHISGASAIQAESGISDLEDFLVAKIAFSVPVQFLQILVDGLRILPLLKDDHSDLVPHPWAVFFQKPLHTPDAEIVDPSPHQLIELHESHADGSGRSPLPAQDFPCLLYLFTMNDKKPVKIGSSSNPGLANSKWACF